MSYRNALGKRGEDFAREILRRRGMEILAERYRTPYGEVDLIARDGDQLCFVEVKTRRMGSRFSGEEAVDSRKQRKIIVTALTYLQEKDLDLQPRFDVLCVYTDSWGHIADYKYIMGAFDGDAYTKAF